MSYCGFDFGTSNSTIGIFVNNNCQLVPLEQNKLSIRSAVFCDNDLKEWLFGQSGIDHYLEGYSGRLMMAIKSVLGSSLMEEKTVIFNKLIPFTDVLAQFVQYVKKQAEVAAKTELTQVVLGRPVRFHDHDDEKDRRAQKTLESILCDVGFKEIIFQYEPIAAALSYEMTIKSEQLALIIDMGGGTSDFTVIRLRPGQTAYNRTEDVLANCGIHIAGTDFDKRINLCTVMPTLGMGSTVKNSNYDIDVPNSFYHDLTTWHTLNKLYQKSTLDRIKSIRTMANEKHLLSRLMVVLQNRLGHHILDTVEMSKQRLSEEKQILLDLSFIETTLQVDLSQMKMTEIIIGQIQQIVDKVEQTVNLAGVNYTDINALFYTGGSTKIPMIRQKINALFPNATIVQGDAFGSVGLGLTIDAHRRYR